MLILDAHCDTITTIMEKNENLYKNSCHIDIKRIKGIGDFIQFFAAFMDPKVYLGHPMRYALEVIEKFNEQIDLNNSLILHCHNYEEIIDAINDKKIAAFLTIEGGDCLEGKIASLRMFYKLGVRSLVLTWNHRNEIADGVGESITNGGLTHFGREVVMEMNKLGMIIDVSHISEKGFWDVLELSKKPVIASHSNAKEICGNRRNLSNRQIMAIKDKNGVIGINLFPVFLNNSGKADLKDIIKHIEHIAGLTGEDNLGLGADFDGILKTPEDIKGIEDVEKIFNELGRLNYAQSFIEKFAGLNFLRVIREVC